MQYSFGGHFSIFVQILFFIVFMFSFIYEMFFSYIGSLCNHLETSQIVFVMTSQGRFGFGVS